MSGVAQLPQTNKEGQNKKAKSAELGKLTEADKANMGRVGTSGPPYIHVWTVMLPT